MSVTEAVLSKVRTRFMAEWALLHLSEVEWDDYGVITGAIKEAWYRGELPWYHAVDTLESWSETTVHHNMWDHSPGDEGWPRWKDERIRYLAAVDLYPKKAPISLDVITDIARNQGNIVDCPVAVRRTLEYVLPHWSYSDRRLLSLRVADHLGIIQDGFSLAMEWSVAVGHHVPGELANFWRRELTDPLGVPGKSSVYLLRVPSLAKWVRTARRRGYKGELLIFDPLREQVDAKRPGLTGIPENEPERLRAELLERLEKTDDFEKWHQELDWGSLWNFVCVVTRACGHSPPDSCPVETPEKNRDTFRGWCAEQRTYNGSLKGNGIFEEYIRALDYFGLVSLKFSLDMVAALHEGSRKQRRQPLKKSFFPTWDS